MTNTETSFNENKYTENKEDGNNWLANANERHIIRIHKAIHDLTATAGTKGKQTNPIYTKMLSTLQFVIDNYHSPIEFIFTDLYTKYSEPGTLDKEINLLFNAMRYDNEFATEEFSTNEVLYMLENIITFVEKGTNDSIKNSFLSAINSKTSPTPNVKYILGCYKEICKLIYENQTEFQTRFSKDELSRTNNVYEQNIDKLSDLQYAIENCLRIQYKVTV